MPALKLSGRIECKQKITQKLGPAPMSISSFNPAIQTTILYLANPTLSFADIGVKLGISKQAVSKRVHLGTDFFSSFGQPIQFPDAVKLAAAEAIIVTLTELVATLQRQIVLYGAIIFLAKAFQAMVHKYFPRFKLRRLNADQKKKILDFYTKFTKLNGSRRDFCRAIGRSESTLQKWSKAFSKHGLAGLVDKPSRPHHFGNEISLWLKNQILVLFLRFPHWNNYQYYKYIRGNPALQRNISLATISKLKNAYTEKSEAEKARLLKLWEFAPGSKIWTVDFTCLLQTERYKIQLLTVSDHRSRFLFETAVVIDTSTEIVMKHLETLFLKYGKPWFIKAVKGPEFRLDCRDKLAEFAVSLFNSPPYYGPFNACHERIHRTLKESVSNFATHHNFTKLVLELDQFREDYNYTLPLESRDMKTPAAMYFSDRDYVSDGKEIVTPYEKDGEIRVKYTNRDGLPSRMSFKDNSKSTGYTHSITPNKSATANPVTAALVN